MSSKNSIVTTIPTSVEDFILPVSTLCPAHILTEMKATKSDGKCHPGEENISAVLFVMLILLYCADGYIYCTGVPRPRMVGTPPGTKEGAHCQIQECGMIKSVLCISNSTGNDLYCGLPVET